MSVSFPSNVEQSSCSTCPALWNEPDTGHALRYMDTCNDTCTGLPRYRRRQEERSEDLACYFAAIGFAQRAAYDGGILVSFATISTVLGSLVCDQWLTQIFATLQLVGAIAIGLRLLRFEDLTQAETTYSFSTYQRGCFSQPISARRVRCHGPGP